jgi:2-polyprenyl-6-methoxyphenol hydroxylase-like FAD-dependent oxidoreductase
MDLREGDGPDVLIVGAGVGGLTLGMLLGEQGFRVTILDQRKAIEPLSKPELLQPAGLEVLDALGVLERLRARPVVRCEVFDFFSAGGRPLCRVDYRRLRHRFPYALIAFPHVTQSVLLDALSNYPTVRVRWGCALSGLVRSLGGLSHATFWENGELKRVAARVVIGADGRHSRVRAAVGIRAVRTNYRDAFVTLVVRRPASFEDAVRYHVGRRRILGIFPISPERLCLLFMVPADGFDAVKARGLSALKAEIEAIDEGTADALSGLTDWSPVSYMDCQTVRVGSWVADGAALLGDAAHACHPHVAQGNTQAMLDATVLCPVLKRCFEDGDFSALRLSAYEKARRPPVERLQRIAHEYAWLWNTGNPLLAWLRDRAFRGIGRRPDLLSKVLETEAGLRVAPLSVPERLQAVGVLP